MSEHDYSCDKLGIPTLDGTMAVGARFELQYLRNGSDPAARHTLAGVNAASPEVAARSTDAAAEGLRFLVPGEAAFLAESTDGTVVDFIHLFAEDVVDMEISRGGLVTDDMGMRAGEVSKITAYPLGPGNAPLLGSVDCTWTSDDDSIVVAPETTSCEIEVEALTAGSTTLHVAIGDTADKEIAVTVEAQP